MASIKCFYCKNVHASIADVKACSTKKTMPSSLDEILGADVNPDPKAELDKWQANLQAENAKIDAAFAAKVEIGTIVETIIPATVKKVAIPAHRLDPKYLALKAQVIKMPFNPAGAAETVKVAEIAQSIASGTAASLTEIQAEVKEQILSEIKKGQDLELGMYQVIGQDGEVIIYKIKWNKTNTYKYAERLWISTKAKWNAETQTWIDMPKGKFIYANSMMKVLTSENKMTEEQAKAFHDATKAKYGIDYGFCCVCAKLLTVKKSIDAGIGPVCAGKL